MWSILQTFDLPFSNEYVNEFVLKQIGNKKVNFRITMTCDFETNDILTTLPEPDRSSFKLCLNNLAVPDVIISKNMYKKTEFVLTRTNCVVNRDLVSKSGYMIKTDLVALTFNGAVKVEVDCESVSSEPDPVQGETGKSSCIIV